MDIDYFYFNSITLGFFDNKCILTSVNKKSGLLINQYRSLRICIYRKNILNCLKPIMKKIGYNRNKKVDKMVRIGY